MEGESTKEKLLQASGVRQEKPDERTRGNSPDEVMQEHLAQMERVIKAVMGDVKNSLTLATQAHDRGEWMIENLKKFCKETLPKQMVQAIDEVAREGVRDSLKPLDESVNRASETVADLQLRAVKIDRYWLRDLVIGGLVIGVLVAVVMVCLVRFLFLGDKVAEAKRYELWGRKVERLIESYPPKQRAQLYHWTGRP